jgi:Lysylphosphatidylglycerol synthase TM region
MYFHRSSHGNDLKMVVENFWLYVIASFLLLVAHVIRAARWALLFPAHEISRRFDLLLGLALGYAINAIVPWRLGELARIWYVARKASVRVSYVATTVVAERLADLIVVSVIAVYVLADVNNNGWLIPLITVSLSIILVSLSYLIRKSQRTRQFIWRLASVFNDRIRFICIDFFWSLSEMIMGGVLLKPRFLITTLIMWMVYVFSYAVFANASGEGLPAMIFAMLGSPLSPAVEQLAIGDRAAAVILLGYTGLPVIGVIVYGGMKQLPGILRVLNARRRYGWYAGRRALSIARNHYKGEGEYEYFLSSLFSGDNKVATSFGLEALDDGTVHKLFVGGSDAITAMVEVDEHLVIRKFAVGPAGDKLKAQHDWLGNYSSQAFPLVRIIRERQKNGSYHYDMPLVVPSNDFYDFIHTNPIEGSKQVISEVVDRITFFHEQHNGGVADESLVGKYLAEKVVSNAASILNFAKTFFDERYFINGKEFNLKQWEYLLDIDWLTAQITDRSTTVVHGDLTIENIIIAPQSSPNWYIIDPNPDNIFNSRLIDWAKLMQSVHLGYEGLNRNFSCIVENDSIQLAFTKSQAYTVLHHQLEALTRQYLNEDGLREVYFHELINYLRLTPYKIRHDPKKGMCFFGCTSILLNRYLERAL